MRTHRIQHRRIARRGFTVIEVLVTAGVILILAGFIVVAVGHARTFAQGAKTQALMSSIRQGLVTFEQDHGYLPPVLDLNRDLFLPPVQGSATYREDIQNWYSVTTLADYLVGYGDHRADGYGAVDGAPANMDWEDELPRTGIRWPNSDGVWGSTLTGAGNGLFTDRMKAFDGTYGSEPQLDPSGAINPADNRDVGKVFGPYIQLQEDRLLASIDGSTDANGMLNTFFPGEAGFDADAPRVIVDYWGKPIRYFRKPYPTGQLGASFLAADYNDDGRPDPVPNLSDIFVIRPWEIGEDEALNNRFEDNASYGADVSTSRRLESASFALLSAGADRAVEILQRVDDNSFNEDNVREYGP